MINNKQINVWRGDHEPPTIYHVWIYGNEKILLHNGTEWVVFIDDIATVARIESLTQRIENVENSVNVLGQHTVNGIAIVEDPVLTGQNIKLDTTGNFLNATDTIGLTFQNIDKLLTTQIIE